MTSADRSELIISPEVLDRLLERVWNPLELKAVLAVIALGGEFEPVTEQALFNHSALRRGSHGDGSSRPFEERLREAIDNAVTHQALLPIVIGEGERALMIWNEQNLSRDRPPLDLTGKHATQESGPAPARSAAFTSYEQHIGALSPVVADRLADAVERYPAGWVIEAIEQAAIYNRRSLRYIERILETWATEGRNGEADRRNHEAHPSAGSRLRDKIQPYLRDRE